MTTGITWRGFPMNNDVKLTNCLLWRRRRLPESAYSEWPIVDQLSHSRSFPLVVHWLDIRTRIQIHCPWIRGMRWSFHQYIRTLVRRKTSEEWINRRGIASKLPTRLGTKRCATDVSNIEIANKLSNYRISFQTEKTNPRKTKPTRPPPEASLMGSSWQSQTMNATAAAIATNHTPFDKCWAMKLFLLDLTIGRISWSIGLNMYGFRII